MKITKTEAEWRSLLTREQYTICRANGTEPPFSGAYHACKEPGMYRCVCCGAPLFDSKTKFDSGTGWPSFWSPAQKDSVSAVTDTSHDMGRTEVLCGACDAHLGHVFTDGPAPTGMRYCINSAALRLDQDSE
ncbi:MAG: peptide-methionine (R)-S-oxide reductase MsrB [Pseudomonadota bacterium]|nr:peptide-methionine (R)-S-oxide reductase MsrB [Pseudomonadota bacterium]